MKTKILTFIAITILLSSCATVKFYDNSELTNESGIEFYSPKPYLVVEKNPSKDISIKTSIIYLPDLSRPKYAKLKSGFGSSDLKLSLENGIITSYGITADSKVPETISAISSLVTGTGSSYKSIAEALDIMKEEKKEIEQSGDIDGMIESEAIIELLKNGIEQEIAKTGDYITSIQKNKMNAIRDSLNTIKNILKLRRTKDIPNIIISMSSLVKQFDEIKTLSDSNNAKDYNGRIEIYKKEIQNAINKISPPKKTDSSSITIYEILIEKGITQLKPIEF